MRVIQSVLFDKRYFNVELATRWLLKEDMKIKKIDETPNYYRFRQIEPAKYGYKFFTQQSSTPGIKYIIMYN